MGETTRSLPGSGSSFPSPPEHAFDEGGQGSPPERLVDDLERHAVGIGEETA
jgi:hypothetical protein